MGTPVNLVSERELKFFVVVGFNDLDGVYVRGVFKDWHKAMTVVGGSPKELRIRAITTFEENL